MTLYFNLLFILKQKRRLENITFIYKNVFIRMISNVRVLIILLEIFIRMIF